MDLAGHKNKQCREIILTQHNFDSSPIRPGNSNGQPLPLDLSRTPRGHRTPGGRWLVGVAVYSSAAAQHTGTEDKPTPTD